MTVFAHLDVRFCLTARFVLQGAQGQENGISEDLMIWKAWSIVFSTIQLFAPLARESFHQGGLCMSWRFSLSSWSYHSCLHFLNECRTLKNPIVLKLEIQIQIQMWSKQFKTCPIHTIKLHLLPPFSPLPLPLSNIIHLSPPLSQRQNPTPPQTLTQKLLI